VQQKNVALHTPGAAAQHAQAVYQQTVVLRLMPMNNATGITDLVRRWFEGGSGLMLARALPAAAKRAC
jgi:uncharacterized membrane protein